MLKFNSHGKLASNECSCSPKDTKKELASSRCEAINYSAKPEQLRFEVGHSHSHMQKHLMKQAPRLACLNWQQESTKKLDNMPRSLLIPVSNGNGLKRAIIALAFGSMERQSFQIKR